jgi:hypothetical protein
MDWKLEARVKRGLLVGGHAVDPGKAAAGEAMPNLVPGKKGI